jgi:hypothetical protein
LNFDFPGGFADPLPPDMEDRLLTEVEPGERLLWAGRPGMVRFALMTLPIFVFGLIWTAFSTVWVWITFRGAVAGAAGGHVDRYLFPLLGLPFAVVGFVMLGSPFWATRKARKTTYALTDRRLIFIEVGLTGAVRTVSLRGDEVGPIERVERKDGSGDLSFCHFVDSRNGHDSPDGQARSFVAIPHVREVESLVRKTLLAGVEWANAGLRTSRTNSGGQP